MTPRDYTLPAEWHRQSSIQLTWPHAETDWQPYLDEIEETFVQIAKAVTQYENLIIAAKQPDTVRTLLEESLTEEEMLRVRLYECDNDDTWARDHAFITLVSTQKGVPCRLLDFHFNGWGKKFDAEKDNSINHTLSNIGAFGNAVRVDCDDFVLEGGSIESDGKGTILTTSQCLLAPNRNEPMTRGDIEATLKERLCARKIVWLNHGTLIGDDTDGHIDTIARLCPDDTIVYVGCDDASDPQYDDFKALERQLQTVTNADGKAFRLMRLPMPKAILFDGERLPATYANFLILNGAVIVPTYNQAENDAKAMSVIAAAFPSYDIIGIDASVIIRQHGSIHCLTMQFPEEVNRA